MIEFSFLGDLFLKLEILKISCKVTYSIEKTICKFSLTYILPISAVHFYLSTKNSPFLKSVSFLHSSSHPFALYLSSLHPDEGLPVSFQFLMSTSNYLFHFMPGQASYSYTQERSRSTRSAVSVATTRRALQLTALIMLDIWYLCTRTLPRSHLRRGSRALRFKVYTTLTDGPVWRFINKRSAVFITFYTT